MAIATPTLIGSSRTTYNTSHLGTTFTAALTSAINAGDTVYVFATSYSNVLPGSVAISDPINGTYTSDAYDATGPCVGIARKTAAAAVASGQNVTVVWANSVDACLIAVVSVASGLQATPLDQSVIGGASGTTALSEGPTGTTTVVPEVVFCAFGTFESSAYGGAFTASGAYTLLYGLTTTPNTTIGMIVVYLNNTASLATQTATANASVAVSLASAVLATYKGSPAAAAAGGRVPSIPALATMPSI